MAEDARFCAQCGTSLSDAGAAPATPDERKVVTVLFADMAGSTALGERLDPERLRALNQSYFDAMRTEIEAEGGTVEKPKSGVDTLEQKLNAGKQREPGEEG